MHYLVVVWLNSRHDFNIFLKMSSDSNFQHTETEFNEVEVWKVWWQISYFTFMWDNEFLNTSITMYADVIHDDYC